MRRLTVISFAALAGCAAPASTGSTAPSPATPLETVRVSGSVGGGTMTVDTHPTSGPTVMRIGFPVERVWNVLKAAFDSLAIPVSSIDPATHTMENSSLRVRRRLGDVSVSKYINCGNTQSANAADGYEIVLPAVDIRRGAGTADHPLVGICPVHVDGPHRDAARPARDGPAQSLGPTTTKPPIARWLCCFDCSRLRSRSADTCRRRRRCPPSCSEWDTSPR
jgi:hypothetical protein